MNMTSGATPFPGQRNLLEKAGRQLERILDCSTICSGLVADDCFRMADKTLDSMNQQQKQDPFNIAGHNSFWIQKLKPFHDFIPKNGKLLKRHYMFNEMAAFLFGRSVLVSHGLQFSDNNNFINSFIISLRYDFLSPSAIILTFKALVRASPR